MNIFSLNPTHSQEICSILAECFPENTAFYLELQEDLVNRFNCPIPHVFLGVRHQTGRLIGYVEVFYLDDCGFVCNLCVVQQCRGIGVGSSLLDFCLGLCRDAGMNSLFLTANPGNDAAISLYNKRGFQQVSEIAPTSPNQLLYAKSL